MNRSSRWLALVMLFAGIVAVPATPESAAEGQDNRQDVDTTANRSAGPKHEPVPLGVACFGGTPDEAFEGLHGFIGYIDERRVTTDHLDRAVNCRNYDGQVSIVLGPDATVSTRVFAVLPASARSDTFAVPPTFGGPLDRMRREIRALCDNNDQHPSKDFPLEAHRYQITRTVFSSGWRIFTQDRGGNYRSAVDPDFDSDMFLIAVTRAGEAKFDDLCKLSRHARDFEERFEAYFTEIAATRRTDG